jgi:trk system potassium uptake protein TrkH
VDAAKRMIGIYILLTAAEALLLIISGMPVFDSICNSFSTLSSGGFSTRNDSLTSFSTPAVKAIVTLFMFFSATNMAVVYYAFKRNFVKIRENSEFRFYLIIITVFSVVMIIALKFLVDKPLLESVQDGIFHVVSVISTTGFYTADFTAWGNFAMFTLFILMFTGGTTGSAAGGVKITRLIIMTSNNRLELRRLIHPEAYIPVRLNRKIVPHNIVYNVLVFITLYFIVICTSAVIISVMGYDIITSFGTSASMLANIGPGLGMFGPLHTYEMMPVAGKYFLAILMFLGRLEMMAVLILFSRSFYRR